MAIASKKNLRFVFFIILALLTLQIILAQDYKLDIQVTKDIFEAGEDISFKITLRDSENNIIPGEVSVILEDSEKKVKIEQTISANKIININLGKEARFGTGTITATYQDAKATALFDVGLNEIAEFKIEGDKLIITNIGNTKYAKTVNIVIGDTAGIKYPKLNVGESISYRLIAPDGTYQIRVYDDKTTLTQGDVQLTGTGNVVGAIDEQASTSGITGTIRDEEAYEDMYGYLKNNKFTYAFILVIFGAMILLAIERKFRKRINE